MSNHAEQSHNASSDGVEEQKQVEFYSAGLSAWYSTRLERDKSLITLSAGGIGLLTTLMTTVGVSSELLLLMYIGALFAFVVCLGAVLVIFQKNATYVESVLTGTAPQSDLVLRMLRGNRGQTPFSPLTQAIAFG